MVHFNCPSCNKKLMATDEYLGKKVKCPKCGRSTVAGGSPVVGTEALDSFVEKMAREDDVKKSSTERPASSTPATTEAPPLSSPSPVYIQQSRQARAGSDLSFWSESSTLITVLVVGTLATIVAQIAKLNNPIDPEAQVRGYSFGVYLGMCLVRLIGYSLCLAFVSVVVAFCLRRGKRVAFIILVLLLLTVVDLRLTS